MEEEIQEDTSGFYKKDNGILLFGPNDIVSKDYSLFRESKDKHQYPTDGWYWFNSEQEAKNKLN
jgi:hypothetical protein